MFNVKEENRLPIDVSGCTTTINLATRLVFFYVFNFIIARSCQYWPIVAVPLNHQDKCDHIGTWNYGNEKTKF